MNANESYRLCAETIHPFGGLANTGSALNIRVYLRSSAADCFFQDEWTSRMSCVMISSMQDHLIDPFQRRIEYVRLSVTDRCDLRCSYCLPQGFRDFEEPEHWLTFDEIERVMRAFTGLGVRRIRLTGGEPLSRGKLQGLAARLP